MQCVNSIYHLQNDKFESSYPPSTFSVSIVVKANLHSLICLVDRTNLRSEDDLIYYMLLTLESQAKLNNGIEIPRLGLGVYQSPPGEITLRAVRYALKIGYRHIDTAELYGNESDVGRAIQESGIRRDDIFITTKVWKSYQGSDSTLRAYEESLRRIGLSYIDLYIQSIGRSKVRQRDMESYDKVMASRQSPSNRSE